MQSVFSLMKTALALLILCTTEKWRQTTTTLHFTMHWHESLIELRAF